MTERVVDLGDKEVENPSEAQSVVQKVVATLIKGCSFDVCLTHVSVKYMSCWQLPVSSWSCDAKCLPDSFDTIN